MTSNKKQYLAQYAKLLSNYELLREDNECIFRELQTMQYRLVDMMKLVVITSITCMVTLTLFCFLQGWVFR